MEVGQHIVLGFGEAVVAPEVCFSLYDQGYRLSIFTRDRRRCSMRFLPFVDLYEVPQPEVDVENTVAALSQLVHTLNADAIMPLDDFSLWLCAHMAENKRLGESCKHVFPEPEAAYVALDKAKQIDAAQAAGLAVPETAIATMKSDVRGWKNFPCIAKPALAVSVQAESSTSSNRLAKGKSSTFADAYHLAEWIERNAACGPFLLQPLIRGEGEGVFGHFYDGKVIGWSAHRRLRMMNPHGSGSSACESRHVDPDLMPKVEDFLRDIGWSGLFMVEMLRQADGTNWFMELNGRAWGSMALARRAGFDYPAWTITSKFAPFHIVVEEIAREGLKARHLGRDLLHLLFVLRGPQDAFYREAWPNRLSTLLQVICPHRGTEFYNYHPKFPTFFLKDAWVTIRNFFWR